MFDYGTGRQTVRVGKTGLIFGSPIATNTDRFHHKAANCPT